MLQERVDLFGGRTLRLNTLYRSIARCMIGKGDTILFCDDLWTDSTYSTKYNTLFHFAKNTRISVKNAMAVENKLMLFNLPLSEQTYNEYLQLQEDISII